MANEPSNTNADSPQPTVYMLTTYDNPYDPFTEFDEWYAWDANAGYHTPGLLARVAQTSDELSEVDQHLALEHAIDEIVRENVFGMHRKVKHGDVARLKEELRSAS